MKKNLLFLFTALAVSSVTAEETTNVTAFIKGKSVEFSQEVRAQVVQKSVDLLASCSYMNAKPKWGTPTEPQSISDAQKQSHLHVMFSSPRKVEISLTKATLHVREMVISFPLITAGIWVRVDNNLIYFAKPSLATAEELVAALTSGQPHK